MCIQIEKQVAQTINNTSLHPCHYETPLQATKALLNDF